VFFVPPRFCGIRPFAPSRPPWSWHGVVLCPWTSELQKEDAMITEEMVRAALKNVVDPEIGLDIVNLGLVYRVDVLNEGRTVDVDMTLTTPACPAGPQIINQARSEIEALKDVYKDLAEVKINLVWTPFWNPSLMSEDAREELGYF
jgi:metal-sulfur cluster biosynthetic enzyme